MTDRILIEGLRADTVVGVFDWERRVRQDLLLDLELHCDLRKAGASDELHDTVDYKSLTSAVRDHVRTSRYRLIETLACDVTELCLRNKRISRARVTVHKPGALRHSADVAVEVLRERGDPSGRPRHTAYIGVGSNIDPVAHIRAGLAELHELFGAIRVSRAYWNDAIGAAGAPRFINLAVAIRTDLDPAAVLHALHQIEDRHGRERGTDPNAARTLDLDLLLFDDLVQADPLTLPHAQVTGAPFVILPLADIAASVRHPVSGETISSLRSNLPRRVPGFEAVKDVLY